MKNKKMIFTLLLVLTICLIPVSSLFAGGLGFTQNQSITTDSADQELISFFDLRERESFIQVTNLDDGDSILHIQIFNVDQDCNENNFFDVYTPSDTHVYNMRDILTNDGNPSGIILPEGAYGFVAVTKVDQIGGDFNVENENILIGNFRILDNNGYEYRTNSQSSTGSFGIGAGGFTPPFNFNFSNKNSIILSDIVLITPSVPFFSEQFDATDLFSAWMLFDVDIVNLNEVVFSCRDIITACTDQDNPLLEELLEFVADISSGAANVAAFEWGINDAIPHSKGGELLCPGNNIEEGFVNLTIESSSEILPTSEGVSLFYGYVGLNNGNERGSMDSIWGPDLSAQPRG